jgi:hypothetical protein
MGKTITIFALLLIILVSSFIIINVNVEGFVNNYKACCNALGSGDNTYTPKDPTNDLLLKNVYPLKDKIGVSNDTADKIWWHYPTFEVGSYAQITNNIKYPNNPDIGRCTATEFCGSIYDEYQTKTNYIKPLSQIDPNCGTRVGYFSTGINLLPYRNDTQNILY